MTSIVEGPRIGLSMLFCLGKPFSSLLRQMRKWDVRYIELLDEGLHELDETKVKILNEIAGSLDLEYSIHAPFAGINIAVPSLNLRQAVMKRLERSIRYASQLDCHLWVFHPGLQTGVSPFYPGMDWQLNLESVKALIKIAQEYDVAIAIENVPEPYPFLMKNVADFARFYKDLQDDIGMVLDVAHANLCRQIPSFFERFSRKIVHMHVSDNDGTNDLHLGIGEGTIDWKHVAKCVKTIQYDNVIILEATDHIQKSLHSLRTLFTRHL